MIKFYHEYIKETELEEDYLKTTYECEFEIEESSFEEMGSIAISRCYVDGKNVPVRELSDEIVKELEDDAWNEYQYGN